MGDGRYYTYYQFFNIVLITFLTIYVVSSAAYSYYRLNDKKNRTHAFIVFSFVILFAILHAVEGVIPNLNMATMLRTIKSIILIALMSDYLFRFIFMWRGASIEVKALNSSKRLLLLGYYLGLFLLTISGVLIEDYRFHRVTYSKLYQGIILMLLITYVVSNLRVILLCKGRHRLNHKGNRIDVIVMMLKVLFLSPLLFYTVALFKNNTRLDFIEILIGFGYVLLLNLDLYTHDESGITLHAFDKMGDMSLDCIFVTDMSGKIIYKNNSSRNSSFFKPTEVMAIGHVQALFNDEIVIKTNHLGREYIVLKHDDEKHYFAFKSGALKERSKEIGRIITITEITELISLLNALEERREISKSVNQKLKKHALVVYRLEKEKEISALLEEIINSREMQMNILSQMIDRTKLNIDAPSFESDIEDSIRKSNAILEDVRQTVSTYRAYYGEDLLTESTAGRYK